MTNQDNQQYITVELFNSKMETLITQIQLGNEKLRNELRNEFHSELSPLKAEVKVNSPKIEMLGHSMYWGLAVMTIIITLVAFFVPYFMMYRKDKKEKDINHTITEDKVKQLIDEALQNISTSTIGK